MAALATTHPDEIIAKGSNAYVGTKPWIEDQLIMLARDAMQVTKQADGSPRRHTVRMNPALAVSTLLALARLKGYVVERKQVDQRNIKADLGKVSRQELSELLGDHLAKLDPAAREKVLRLADGGLDEASIVDVPSE